MVVELVTLLGAEDVASIDPMDNCSNDADSSEKVSCEFVVTFRDGAKIFQSAKVSLYDISLGVAFGIEGKRLLAVGFFGNDGGCAAAPEKMPQSAASYLLSPSRCGLGSAAASRELPP